MVRTTIACGVVALAVASLVAGCGRSAGDAGAARSLAGPKLSAKAAAAAAADADMVSAVSATGSTTPVGLKFRVRAPPQIGDSLELELALAQEPGLDIQAMLVSLLPGDGLALESDRSFEFRAPEVGATQRMVATLRAEQAGVLNLSVTVLIDSGTTSQTRNFSIPLIAAAPAQ